jgi:endo-1,4-beta-xylanase
MGASLFIASLIAGARCAYLTDTALRAEYGSPVPLPPPRFRGGGAPAVGAGALPPLRAAAAARGLYIGAAINEACYANASEPQYAATFLSELSLATCENGCKFAATEPARGAFAFSECDFISQRALVDGRGAFRGHNFVWGEGVPGWVTGGGFSPAALRGVMEAHIAGVLDHYARPPFFECWDVVNEAVCDTGAQAFNCSDPKKLWKTNVWTPAGEGAAQGGYVELAFAAAARAVGAASGGAAPTRWFYNDYAGEAAGTPKSDKIYSMLKDFTQRGVPVSGVGLQVRCRARALSR